MAVDAARAESLFLAASDLADPAERAAFLDRECGGDAELRGRVEALLRANDAAPPATVDSAGGQRRRASCNFWLGGRRTANRGRWRSDCPRRSHPRRQVQAD